ncbi:MAG: hypothetical protein OIF32_06325 [Campylobacterales bacterium]|nr:hypothetical protein [Campylobacterales bacterium]
MGKNKIVEIWNDSVDIQEFKKKIEGISIKEEDILKLEIYLRGSYGEDFQAKKIIESISEDLKAA